MPALLPFLVPWLGKRVALMKIQLLSIGAVLKTDSWIYLLFLYDFIKTTERRGRKKIMVI